MADEDRKRTKCAPYMGDIDKVVARCDSGLCIPDDPFFQKQETVSPPSSRPQEEICQDLAIRQENDHNVEAMVTACTQDSDCVPLATPYCGLLSAVHKDYAACQNAYAGASSLESIINCVQQKPDLSSVETRCHLNVCKIKPRDDLFIYERRRH